MSPQDLPSGYEGLRVGFTAAVSHELRTPLARLLSLLDTAKLPGVDVQELIDEACAEVVEMTQLVDDILFLSELEQGREVVALGFTELAPHVARAVRASRASARCAPSSRSRCDVPAGLVVPMRPRMLQVVLGNLLDNALRYAGRGATFRIAARQEGDTVVLEVSDDGAGVDPSDVPRLFERFFRSDRSRTTRGTGLGLAIVEAHRRPPADGTARGRHQRRTNPLRRRARELSASSLPAPRRCATRRIAVCHVASRGAHGARGRRHAPSVPDSWGRPSAGQTQVSIVEGSRSARG